jgi:hypothetical protein
MRTVMIAYDLCDGHDEPSELTAAIRRMADRWARPLAALWLVETASAVTEVEAALAAHLGDDDALVVQELAGCAAVANTMLRWTSDRAFGDVDGAGAAGRGLLHLVAQDRRLPTSQAGVAEAA